MQLGNGNAGSRPLSAAELSAFNAGTKKLYVYGLFTYKFRPTSPQIVKPFCKYRDITSDRIWACPKFNTEYGP